MFTHKEVAYRRNTAWDYVYRVTKEKIFGVQIRKLYWIIFETQNEENCHCEEREKKCWILLKRNEIFENEIFLSENRKNDGCLFGAIYNQ